MTPQEYRKQHHRCKFCIYKKFYGSDAGRAAGYECLVKDKYIPEFDFLEKGRGIFCKCYKAKEINFEI